MEELMLDYEDFLRHRNLLQWQRTDERWKSLIKRRCETADEASGWIIEQCDKDTDRDNKTMYPEYSANAALILISVASSLLSKQLNSIAEEFKHEGGFSEKLYRVIKRKGISRNEKM